METLHVTSRRDKEQFNQILDDLINANREFRILITVPSGEMSQEPSEHRIDESELSKSEAKRS